MGLAGKLATAGAPGQQPPGGAYPPPSAPPAPTGMMPGQQGPPPPGYPGGPQGARPGMPPGPSPYPAPGMGPPGAAAPNPFGAPAGPYGAAPSANPFAAAPATGNPFAGPPAAAGAPGAPPGAPYGMPQGAAAPRPGMPPAGMPYGAPPGAPGAPPYGAPQGMPYGAPPGAPPGGNPYGAPPGAAAAAGGGYGAAPGAYPGVPAPLPPGAAVGGAPGGMAGALLTKLTNIVNVNSLQRFYPPQALQALAARLDSRVNFTDLAARWRLPKELALDLASLALYDIVMFVDDSGSMAFEENGERIDDLKLIASKVAEVATLFDDDGILMRFMNSNLEGNGLRSAADVAALLGQIQYCGTTPLASSLQSKVLAPIVYRLADQGQLSKPVLIISITDGEPTDTPKDLVVQTILQARQRLAAWGPKTVAFEFAQVGKDARACNFLQQLDQDPRVGNSIDATSYYELEQTEYAKKGVQLSPELWLVKMMVGAVDPTYDEQDE